MFLVTRISKTAGFVVFFFALNLSADPIQPDRPGFSTGTYTVEPGMTHLEMGFQYDYNGKNGEPDVLTTPLVNVRVGINPKTEINILMDGWSRTSRDTTVSDILVGVKHRLIESDEYNVSVLGYIALPTGEDSKSGYLNPFIALLWDYNLSDSVSAFGTLQVISNIESNQRATNFQPAVGLSFSHTSKLSTYVEYYRDISLNSNTIDIDMFDAGIAYLLTDDMQIDFNFGLSIDNESSDFFAAGVAVRF